MAKKQATVNVTFNARELYQSICALQGQIHEDEQAEQKTPRTDKLRSLLTKLEQALLKGLEQ